MIRRECRLGVQAQRTAVEGQRGTLSPGISNAEGRARWPNLNRHVRNLVRFLVAVAFGEKPTTEVHLARGNEVRGDGMRPRIASKFLYQ